MHGTMLGANPFLFLIGNQIVWWLRLPVSPSVRQEGMPCYFTMDAGPNVKVLLFVNR